MLSRFIFIFLAALLFSSCKVVLPHAGYLPSAQPIPKPVYRGNDTSAFSFNIGYNMLNLPGNDKSFSLSESNRIYKSGLLSSVSGEANWSKVCSLYNYGFGVFGYGGNYILRDSNFTYTNQPYSGIGLKSSFGLSVHGNKASWHVANFQLALAKDFGKYTTYRNSLYPFNSLDGDNRIVPGNALATSFLISTQADFFTRGKVGFGITLGYCFQGYWHNGLVNYSRAIQGGPTLRINNLRIGYSGYLAANGGGGGDVRLTVFL